MARLIRDSTRHTRPPARNEPGWNSGARDAFPHHVDVRSGALVSRKRLELVQSTLMQAVGGSRRALDVANVGCGAGTQCRLWAKQGHRVSGIDINKALIALARKRAGEAGLNIAFDVASATALPWPDQSMDLCIVPELLEYVPDWRACLAECVRVLRPGGALYLSTSNLLCPFQQQFDLPLYSWYPGFLKRHFEDLASTSRPELAGYAATPAVNWFSFYGLRKHLARHGLSSVDRIDMLELGKHSMPKRLLLQLVRSLPPLRFCAHILTPHTIVLAFKAAA